MASSISAVLMETCTRSTRKPERRSGSSRLSLRARLRPRQRSRTVSFSDRNGVVYIGSVDGNVYAVDEETGKEKWKFKTLASRQVTSSPTIANGLVYRSEWRRLYRQC